MFDPKLGKPILDMVVEETGLSRYDALQILHNWTAVPGYVDGQLVAAMAHFGTEVHFAISKDYRGKTINRRRTREFLRPLFDEKGFLTTRIQIGDVKPRRFVERIGFKHTWSDAKYDYFILDELPFERNAHV